MGVSMETEQQLWTLFQTDQQRIGALDTNMITIRGWTITLISALAGFSLSQHHRNLLLVAMVGTVLFGLLDVRYRSTQLLHAYRANKIEQDLVDAKYRLRQDDPGGPAWLSTLIRFRYRSAISFYAVVLLLLLLLWVVT
jgi:uncharacterized membrane protein